MSVNRQVRLTNCGRVGFNPRNPPNYMGGYHQNFAEPGSGAGNYTELSRTTVPTGLTDGTDFYFVFTTKWAYGHSGDQGVARGLLTIGQEYSGYGDNYHAIRIEIYGGGATNLNILTNTALDHSVESFDQTIDVGFDDSWTTGGDLGPLETHTIGISFSDTAASCFFVRHGAQSVQVHTMSNTGPNNDYPPSFGGSPNDALHVGTPNSTEWVLLNYLSALDTDGNFNKAVADVSFGVGYLDFTDPEVYGLYYRNGRAVRPLRDGDYSNGRPLIFFGGHQRAIDWNLGTNLGSGGDFTQSGTVDFTDCRNGPDP
jgi:hypothetical protein